MLTLPKPTSDTPDLDRLRDLLLALPAEARPRWGRMNAAQMLAHCDAFHRLCLGEVRVGLPVRLLARAIGPLFLRRFLRKSPREAPRNLRTLEPLRQADGVTPDFDAVRARLREGVAALQALEDGHRHPLYGPMASTSVRDLARHHMAHHANQFGVLGEE